MSKFGTVVYDRGHFQQINFQFGQKNFQDEFNKYFLKIFNNDVGKLKKDAFFMVGKSKIKLN